MKYIRIISKAPLTYATGFDCLNDNDVITAKVSDHHPIVHDGVFFWNMMMQCNTRGNGYGFNNGFGIKETDEEYKKRLKRVALVIVEAVLRDPSIELISLCEGPIKPEHVEALFHSLMKFSVMARFRIKDMFHTPTAAGQKWGLLMLADTRYTVTKISGNSIEKLSQLNNRFQLWKLEQPAKEKYIALAHFPFSGDEHKKEKMDISLKGQEYCEQISALMEHHRDDSFIFCADFNFNPYLISQYQDRTLDKITTNNSILLTVEGVTHKQAIKTVTVDGVLLSLREKQKYHISHAEPELFKKLKSEYRFFLPYMKRAIEDTVQKESGNRFDPIPYSSRMIIT